MTQAETEAWLSRGWEWLESHQGDPKFAVAEEAWLRKLREYEAACRLTGINSLMSKHATHST